MAIEFEVLCDGCGKTLEARTVNGSFSGKVRTPHISVEPCAECLKEAEEKGYEHGVEVTESEES